MTYTEAVDMLEAMDLDWASSRERFKEHRYHGGTYDRGSADYYYWRSLSPHKYPNGTYVTDEVTVLTEDELLAYFAGYHFETDRKDWY
jgi:hypothetical protein